MCMCVRRSMFFGVSYLVLWDNVQNKPDQSTLGRDERKREKMGFITHSGDRSLSLQGEKKKTKKNPHTQYSFTPKYQPSQKKQKAAGTCTTQCNFTKWENYQAALRGAGSENWVKNSAALCRSSGYAFLLLH